MKLSFTPELSEDENGLAVLGFRHDGFFITNPFVDESSILPVDSVDAYAVSRADAELLVTLNDTLAAATEAALTAGCRVIQDVLGVPGDFAGVYFSGPSYKGVRELRGVLAEYLKAELTAG